MKEKNVKDKQKKKVSKATKGMEEFYRKKKVGDNIFNGDHSVLICDADGIHCNPADECGHEEVL